MNPNLSPDTIVPDPSGKEIIDMLPSLLTNGIDDSVLRVRVKYLRLNDPTYLEASEKYERSLFRLYEAKHFALPRIPDLDIVAYVLDDEYRERVNFKLHKLYDSKYAQDEYALAIKLTKDERYSEASKHFYNAALNGNSDAQYYYGVSVASGDTGNPDMTEAAFWYFVSAKSGCKNAMISLAIIYSNATGIIQNKYMATHWYARAAKELVPYATYNLGVILTNEDVVKGHAAVGKQLKLCAERLKGSVFEEYVREKASLVLDLIAPQALNI